MLLERIVNKTLELLTIQREKVELIKATSEGVANLYSEYKTLKDLELIQECITRISNEGDAQNQIWQAQVVLPFIIQRNPKLAGILLA